MPWAQQVQRLARQEPESQGQGQAVGQAFGENALAWRPPPPDPFLNATREPGRPSSLGRRLAARVIDSLVFGAVVAAAAVPLSGAAIQHVQDKLDEAKATGVTVQVWLIDGTTGMYLGLLAAVVLLFGFLYEALPTAKWGRTLGKRLMRIRVLDIEGHDVPGIRQSLRRWLVYHVLGLLVIGVLDVLWCLFDRPWRQCWHDKAARTFVAAEG
jgi:uncharacterized RDD family membrane protein YckC